MHSQKMSEQTSYRIMVALQGESGTGKTFSALTFPNPVVADLDNNLVAYRDRTDVIRLPFKDKEWLKKWYKWDEAKIKFPIRDAFLKWIQTEGTKLEADQSFVLDGWTSLQENFDLQVALEPVYTGTGKLNEFSPWDRKQDYSLEVLDALSSMKCNIVVTFHEQSIRSGMGELQGKIEPLMKGGYNKKLGKHFTDWFRCIAESKLDAVDKKKVIGAEYKWQVKSASEINLKTRMKVDGMYVEPHYKSFAQYFPAIQQENQQTTNIK